MNLSVELAPKRGLRIKNPVIVASGTFGYGTEWAPLIEIERLGAIVSKGITLHPRRGCPLPRLAETPGGMLNAIGLDNPGVRAVIAEKAPLWATWGVPVIVNLGGETLEEYAEAALLLNGVPGVAGIELNISCPNMEAGGMIFGSRPELAAQVTQAVRAATTLPLIVKLTPNVTDVVEIAQAVVEAGADALTLINTLLGMAIDVKKRRPVLGNITGGLSGPAIKPVALRIVYQVAQAVGVPLIGVGGISSTYDALEFIMAGVRAVQVGTATFRNPRTCLEIIAGLEAFLREEGIEDIGELVGAALPVGLQGAPGEECLHRKSPL